MTISFRPALRDKTPLMIGLAGPSRSGKTMSALRIATGLAQGKPIVMIDTEAKRGLQYADRFQYLHGDLSAPFSPANYTNAVKQAMELEPAVIIVDSASHMHEGQGGVLEMHDKELDRRAGDDYKRREKLTFSAWIEPKHQVNMFVNAMLQTPVHFIFCFRAKDKLKLEAGKDPVSLGWTPIITDRFEYEMSFLLVLPEGSQGRPDFSAPSHGLRTPFEQYIKDGVQLDEQLGQRLGEWAYGLAPRSYAPEPPPVEAGLTVEQWRKALQTSRTLEELAETWIALPKHLQIQMVETKDARKKELLPPAPPDSDLSVPLPEEAKPKPRTAVEKAEDAAKRNTKQADV